MGQTAFYTWYYDRDGALDCARDKRKMLVGKCYSEGKAGQGLFLACLGACLNGAVAELQA